MRSGTQQTVNYAKKKGLQIIYIHPDTAQVTTEDATLWKDVYKRQHYTVVWD